MAANKQTKPSARYQRVVELRRSNAASAVPSGKRKTRAQQVRDWKKEVA